MRATSPPTVSIDGTQVRELRKLAGFSQVTFAARIGISPPYLCRIETGAKRQISPTTFGAICRVLGIPVKDRKELLCPAEQAEAA